MSLTLPHRFGTRAALTLATVILCLPARPGAAEVRLQQDSGGTFTIGVLSWWDIPFRSVVRQRYDFSCGSASIATLLTYHYRRPLSEREAFAAMWRVGDRPAIRARGFSLLDMRTYLLSMGYRAEGFRLSISQLAKVRRPLVALLDLNGYKHFVIIKGMHANRVLTGDPTLGLIEYDSKTFARHWDGTVLAILKTPDRIIPGYNLPGDWGPWSRAPLEQGGGVRVAAFDTNAELPPQYQITPDLMIPVRIGTVE